MPCSVQGPWRHITPYYEYLQRTSTMYCSVHTPCYFYPLAWNTRIHVSVRSLPSLFPFLKPKHVQQASLVRASRPVLLSQPITLLALFSQNHQGYQIIRPNILLHDITNRQGNAAPIVSLVLCHNFIFILTYISITYYKYYLACSQFAVGYCTQSNGPASPCLSLAIARHVLRLSPTSTWIPIPTVSLPSPSPYKADTRLQGE